MDNSHIKNIRDQLSMKSSNLFVGTNTNRETIVNMQIRKNKKIKLPTTSLLKQ